MIELYNISGVFTRGGEVELYNISGFLQEEVW